MPVCKDIDDDDGANNNNNNNNTNNTINSRRDDDDDDGPNVECEEWRIFAGLLLDRFAGVSCGGCCLFRAIARTVRGVTMVAKRGCACEYEEEEPAKESDPSPDEGFLPFGNHRASQSVSQSTSQSRAKTKKTKK